LLIGVSVWVTISLKGSYQITSTGTTNSHSSIGPHEVKYQVIPCSGLNYKESDCTQIIPDTIKDRFGKIRDYKTGNDWADLIYTDEDGNTKQISRAELCWSKTFTSHKGSFLYISAQNSLSFGGVIVRIYIDGVLVKASTSKGAYAIASANSRL